MSDDIDPHSFDDKSSSRLPATMKKIFAFALIFLAAVWLFSEKKFTLSLTPAGYSEPADQKIDVHPEVLNLQESFARVAQVVKPAVVNIATVQIEQYQENPFEFFFWGPDEDFFDQFFNLPQQQQQPRSRKQIPKRYQRKIPGTGSGVIIDPDGYILTNEHVVKDANEIKVTLADDPDKKLDGKVIGRDERTDLAVIKIKSYKKLPYAKLGNSDGIRVGDWAIAIGSPFGLEQTVTVGVISASRQNLPIGERNYKDLIQTDAAINPGNSGGPLLNIHGEVIGINTAIYTPNGGFAGIGFAIPINRAKEIIPQLREKGKVVRGWMGVTLESKIDDATASVFGVPDKQGAMIRDVLVDYPAAKAGLKRGDIIREYDGKKVKDNSDLQTLVAATPPSKKVPVKIIRNKKEMTLELTVAEAPASMDHLKPSTEELAPEESEKGTTASWLGMTVKEISATAREHFSIPESEKGLIIIDLVDGSKADEIGLMRGDVIRAVNQEAVSDLKSFKEVIKRVNTEKGVVFDLVRRGESMYLSYMGPGK